MPRSEAGFRVQLTAAHTDQQIDDLLTVLTDLTTAGHLRTKDGFP